MQELQLNDLTIRPATKDDLDGVCEVIRAYSLELFGIDNNAKRNVEMTWGQPGLPLPQAGCLKPRPQLQSPRPD